MDQPCAEDPRACQRRFQTISLDHNSYIKILLVYLMVYITIIFHKYIVNSKPIRELDDHSYQNILFLPIVCEFSLGECFHVAFSTVLNFTSLDRFLHKSREYNLPCFLELWRRSDGFMHFSWVLKQKMYPTHLPEI